jgi:hypothetical protein
MRQKWRKSSAIIIDRLESKEEDLPYKTIVINTILKEENQQEANS